MNRIRSGLFRPFKYARAIFSFAFHNTVMLKRAAAAHAFTNGESIQSQGATPSLRTQATYKQCSTRPLSTSLSTGNDHKTSVAAKRKFDRSISTMSTSNNNLSQLHELVYFDENDFDDDSKLEINYSVSQDAPTKREAEVKYPVIDSVTYPSLPPQTPSQKNPQSSASIPWSTSPPEHLARPEPVFAQPVPSPERPSKRRKFPWAKSDNEHVSLPAIQDNHQKYPWDKSASVVKNEQKELRRRNAAKVTVGRTASDKPQENVPATHLSEEQLAVAKSVVEDGKSVFFTGSAGTGKSVLMRAIIARLRKKYTREPDRLAITASTGLAACVIEGTTLHSWAGIGLGKEPVPELCKKIKRNAKTKTKWMRTKVLIIDEISMVDAELFDKLEQIARTIRNNGRPFGGIQLVVTGDFFQLPPVPDKNSVAKFAFDAATWNTCVQHTILLTHVFRQKDPAFANMLNEMRLGNLSQESIRNFQKLSRNLQFNDEIDATELFPTRMEVDNANISRMQRLSGQELVYHAQDSGVNDENVRKKILANFMAPEILTLKKGAQVMLIKNIDSQLVNGTLGKIIAFMDESCYAAYKDDEETYHLAHEEPGGSDDEEKAAARKRWDLAKYKNKDGQTTRYWPMVRFPLADGTVRDMLCMPEEWKTENQQNEITAKRVQVPLILAWALSIHKAQGQTLNRVKVDLGKVFEKGQAYVALSRATSQDGLQVLRFSASKVMVHPKVINFYQKLVSIDTVVGLKQDNKQVVTAYEPSKQVIDEDEELYMYG